MIFNIFEAADRFYALPFLFYIFIIYYHFLFVKRFFAVTVKIVFKLIKFQNIYCNFLRVII